MACSLYDEAMAIHSFSGMKNARLDVESLVTGILSQESSCTQQRWVETNVLIIDEVSQLCAKNFEIITILAERVRGIKKLFGGLQLICAGDFFQLSPIKSDVDEGKYCFESLLWKQVFGHSVMLEKVYRSDLL